LRAGRREVVGGWRRLHNEELHDVAGTKRGEISTKF